tara:strand:+ start:285 stop:578 length:294 start_codon:yes stop_codon:yes gene_type:complete
MTDTTDPQTQAVLAAMSDAETKAWEGLSGYKFWMFGYHAARWVNYNQLLPRVRRFRNPFKALVEIGARKVEKSQMELPSLEINKITLPLLGSEGDGA